MDEWVYTVELATLTRRKKTRVLVEGQPVALFLVGSDVFALDDVCIHKQRSLSKGALWRGRVICPGHQWAFDPATGWAQEHERCQPTYDVRVSEGKVFVHPTKRVRAAIST